MVCQTDCVLEERRGREQIHPGNCGQQGTPSTELTAFGKGFHRGGFVWPGWWASRCSGKG